MIYVLKYLKVQVLRFKVTIIGEVNRVKITRKVKTKSKRKDSYNRDESKNELLHMHRQYRCKNSRKSQQLWKRRIKMLLLLSVHYDL